MSTPKPNTPNTLAWTVQLGTPPEKPRGKKKPKTNPWTTPLK